MTRESSILHSSSRIPFARLRGRCPSLRSGPTPARRTSASNADDHHFQSSLLGPPAEGRRCRRRRGFIRLHRLGRADCGRESGSDVRQVVSRFAANVQSGVAARARPGLWVTESSSCPRATDRSAVTPVTVASGHGCVNRREWVSPSSGLRGAGRPRRHPWREHVRDDGSERFHAEVVTTRSSDRNLR